MAQRRAGRRRPRVSVRRLGAARALQVDGSFASLYTPGRARSGPVWDALAAPLAWLPPARRRSVLLLGLGGGSAARLARALAPRARIVGVEIDPAVVRTARRAFDLDALGLEVVVEDARRFLRRDRRSYDLVVEDVFVGSGRAVHKPDWLPEPELGRVVRRVAAGGLLVCNALDEAPAVARAVGRRFRGAVQIGVEGYDNRISVGGPGTLCARSLRAAVGANPLLTSALRDLRFRTLKNQEGGLRKGTVLRN